MPAKRVRVGCSAGCRLGCSYKLNKDVRKNLFDQFYSLESHDLQTGFLSSCIKSSSVRSHGVGPARCRRKHTLSYKFMVDGEHKAICKMAFKATLDVSDGRIQ